MASTRQEAGKLRRSSWFRGFARAGYSVAGVLHIIIGALAIGVASGAGGEADQSGALGALASTPFGGVLLWAVVVGMAALVIWQILETITATGEDAKKRWAARAKEAGKGVAYAAVGVTAIRFAMGGGSSSEQSAQGAAAGLLASPFGIAAVLLVAAVALAVGIAFIWKGATKKFLETIVRPPGTLGTVTEVLGVVGYIAKGIAVGVVGILFGVAAFTADPKKAGGLDGALKALASLPFGVVILIAVGLGLIAYGVYFQFRAWRARL